MLSAGEYRDRLEFQRLDTTADALGNVSSGAWIKLFHDRGHFIPERSSERLSAGRLESAVSGSLMVRASTITRGVTNADRVLINDEPYNIRAIVRNDRLARELDITVERGVAV